MSNLLDCINGYAGQFKNLTSEELEDYVRQVIAKAREYDELRPQEALRKAQREINDSAKKDYLSNAQVIINNQQKFTTLAEHIGTDEKSGTLRDLVGRRYTSLANNVESSQEAAVNRMYSALLDSLSDEDVSYFQDAKNDDEIAKARDGKKASPQASRIAKAIDDYLNTRDANLVTSDAMPLENINKDRSFRAVHDREALLAGGRQTLWTKLGNTATKIRNLELKKSIAGSPAYVAVRDGWINFIKQHLDLEKTFEYTRAMTPEGDLDHSIVHDMLSNIYDNIVNGRSEIFTRSAVIDDAEAIKKRARMFFQWKDNESFLAYNREYGQGNLYDAALRDAQASGRTIGRAEIFGSDPDIMYGELRRAQLERNPKSQSWMNKTDIFYKEVKGQYAAAVNPEMAQFFGNLRSWSAIARLPGLLMTSLSDVNMGASYGWRWGRSYGKAMMDQLNGIVRQGTDEELKEIGRSMHLQLRSHIGYMGKASAAENVGQLTQKFSTKYFRATGMKMWDGGNRMGAMHGTADDLGRASNKTFANLDPMMQKQLTKFGIGEKEWDLLRSKTPTGGDTRLFTLDNVNKLTDDEIKAAYTARGGMNYTNNIRNELYRKVFSMFEVSAENAILSPSAWGRSLMHQGTNPGTWKGELFRSVFQFKGFAISYIDRALIQGFKDADGAQAKLYYAWQQFGLVVPLSFLSTYFYYMSQGRQMPDPTQMSFGENLNFFAGLISPALGIFSTILDPKKQNQNLLSSIMLTPAMRLMSDLLSAPLSLASGNPEQAGKTMQHAIGYMVPSTALPFAQPLTRAFLGEPAFK